MTQNNTTNSHHDVWGDNEFAGHYHVDENGNTFEIHTKKKVEQKTVEPVKKEEPKKIVKPKPKKQKMHYVQVGKYDGTYDVYDDDYEYCHS